MSINEIKDIKKLQTWLKQNIEQVRYLKECCNRAGKELEKNSFAWDSKEKNLVVQALELNQRYEYKKQECEKYEQTLNEIEQHCNEQNLKYDTTACEILDIINKAKESK